MMLSWWRGISLRNKIFISFGLLILISTAVIAVFSYSLTASELDAYALKNIDRNIEYVSKEIESQLQNTKTQSILFARDKTVREALDHYGEHSTLQKWENWSSLQSACNFWTAARQLTQIRIHLYENHQFLRDGLRFVSNASKPEELKNKQGSQDVYWELFSDAGEYSCFAPVISGWQEVGYVEVQANIAPIIKAMDTYSQTGMKFYLTDGEFLLDASGVSSAYSISLELSEAVNTFAHINQTVNGVKMLYTALKMPDYPLYLIGEMPAALLNQAALTTLRSLIIILAVVLICTFLLAWLISRSICLRLEKLKTAMGTIQAGQLDVKVEESSRDEMGQILTAFNHMATDLKISTEAALHSERVSREAELRLMQAQINPHFINNTLESISWASAGHDTEHVQYLVGNLSHFLRSTLSKPRQMTTLSAEITAIRSYWNIQTYRFGDKIELSIEVSPKALSVLLSPMLLQPLIENALLHGILARTERVGHIYLRADVADELLIVEVEDDGVGIPSDELVKLQSALDSHTQGSYGLWNVHQRVRTQYGEAFGLSIQSTPKTGTLCILTLPIQK